MNGYTENKAARYRLPNTTTMEDLAMEVNATVALPGFTSSLTHRKKRAWTKSNAD